MPLTTGIFLRIIAEAAEEDLKEGERLPHTGGKFPGRVKLQAQRLKKEGHIIIEEKRRLKVEGYVKALHEF